MSFLSSGRILTRVADTVSPAEPRVGRTFTKLDEDCLLVDLATVARRAADLTAEQQRRLALARKLMRKPGRGRADVADALVEARLAATGLNEHFHIIRTRVGN